MEGSQNTSKPKARAPNWSDAAEMQLVAQWYRRSKDLSDAKANNSLRSKIWEDTRLACDKEFELQHMPSLASFKNEQLSKKINNLKGKYIRMRDKGNKIGAGRVPELETEFYKVSRSTVPTASSIG